MAADDIVSAVVRATVAGEKSVIDKDGLFPVLEAMSYRSDNPDITKI